MRCLIEILSEQDAVDMYCDYKEKNPILFISISDISDNLTFESNCNIILKQLFFSDITPIDKEKGSNGNLMTLENAKCIREAVEDAVNKGIERIIVHCKAGISRSAAVGCVIARVLNKDDMYLWKTGMYSPNIYCYELMCKAFEIEFSIQDFKYKGRISNRVLDKRFKDYGVNINDMFL